MPTAAKRPAIVSAITYSDRDWLMPKSKVTPIDPMQWVKEHQTELENKVMTHPEFLEACGKANANPKQKFKELTAQLLNPPNDFWKNFALMMGQSLNLQVQHPVNLTTPREQLIENTLFNSFSRFVKKPFEKPI